MKSLQTNLFTSLQCPATWSVVAGNTYSCLNTMSKEKESGRSPRTEKSRAEEETKRLGDGLMGYGQWVIRWWVMGLINSLYTLINTLLI